MLPPNIGVHHMPHTYSHLLPPSVGVIERPYCPNCKTRMMLARISPGPPGFDHRLFECPKCNNVENVIVADDPMKSRALGWLAGELRPPK